MTKIEQLIKNYEEADSNAEEKEEWVILKSYVEDLQHRVVLGEYQEASGQLTYFNTWLLLHTNNKLVKLWKLLHDAGDE